MKTKKELYKELHDMTKADLIAFGRKTVQSIANRRITNLRKKAPNSPALRYIEESGGKISLTKKMTVRQLRKEIVRGQQFLQKETSTVRGYKKALTKAKKSIKKATGRQKIDTAVLDAAWLAYDELKNLNPLIADTENKYTTLDKVISMLENGNALEETILKMNEDLTKAYEAEQEAEQMFDLSASKYLKRDW